VIGRLVININDGRDCH